MKVLHRFANLISSFIITVLYILISIYDRGYINFDLWDKDVTNKSFLIFFLVLFILNLNLRPKKLTIEEKLENIEKHQSLKKQLSELTDIKNNIETSLKNSLTKEDELKEKRKVLFDKIQITKRNTTRDMQLKSRASIELYDEKLEKITEEIENLEPEISQKRAQLNSVDNKIRLIKSKKQSNEQERVILEKELKKIF